MDSAREREILKSMFDDFVSLLDKGAALSDVPEGKFTGLLTIINKHREKITELFIDEAAKHPEPLAAFPALRLLTRIAGRVVAEEETKDGDAIQGQADGR